MISEEETACSTATTTTTTSATTTTVKCSEHWALSNNKMYLITKCIIAVVIRDRRRRRRRRRRWWQRMHSAMKCMVDAAQTYIGITSKMAMCLYAWSAHSAPSPTGFSFSSFYQLIIYHISIRCYYRRRRYRRRRHHRHHCNCCSVVLRSVRHMHKHSSFILFCTQYFISVNKLSGIQANIDGCTCRMEQSLRLVRTHRMFS